MLSRRIGVKTALGEKCSFELLSAVIEKESRTGWRITDSSFSSTLLFLLHHNSTNQQWECLLIKEQYNNKLLSVVTLILSPGSITTSILSLKKKTERSVNCYRAPTLETPSIHVTKIHFSLYKNSSTTTCPSGQANTMGFITYQNTHINY